MTPMVADLERDGKVDLSRARQRIPMGRLARPDEIAADDEGESESLVLLGKHRCPICSTAMDAYLFVSAMTTVSAAIFLYSPDTILAAVAVLNMDDAGNVGGAAAMSTLILFTSAGVSLLLAWASRGLLRRSQAWRQTAPGQ